jgi:hypothetical protein
MDRLEEYIRRNRDELDKLEPSREVWQRISKNSGNGRYRLYKWVAAAASIVIIAAISILIPKNSDNAPYPEISAGRKYEKDAQVKEMEQYYNSVISSLYSEAAPLMTEYPELKSEFSSDINHLDSIFYSIRNDLKDNIANQEVISALIQNYRIRIKILEDMLTILKDNDSIPEKKKDHEL